MFESEEDMSPIYYCVIQPANLIHSPVLILFLPLPFSLFFALAFVLSSHSTVSLAAGGPHVISPSRKVRSTVILPVVCSRSNKSFIRIEILYQ
jgi:hypothetical protein